jgi:hypothetical protein
MINVRLVSEIIKDGSTYTLVSVKITADNPDDKKSAQAVKGVEEQFTNVSSLFSAIENETIALVQSGLV